jgi:acetyl esterase/lipase
LRHTAPTTPLSPRRRRRAGAARIAATAATLAAALLSPPCADAGARVTADPYGPMYEHIHYGPLLAQYLNIYQAPDAGSPIVVLVRGGGWRAFDPLTDFESESLSLQQQGFTVVTIQYRPDTERRPAFPTEPTDVRLAVEWAIANGSRYDGNPADVVLLGASAGGQLVDVIGEQLAAADPGAIRGVVSLSGPADLRSLTRMIQTGVVSNEEFVSSVYRAEARNGETGQPYLYTTPWKQEAFEARWSPALSAPGACTKWLLFNSEAELVPLSQAQELNSNLQRAGCQSTLQVVPGTRHAFAYWKTVAPQVFGFIRGA